MKLQNIHNVGRFIYLFLRDDNGKQVIQKVNDYYPYYYELYQSNLGDKKLYKTFDGKDVYKIEVPNPADIRKFASPNAYESDIPYVKKFLIDRIDKIEKSNTKFCMYDIEIDSPDEFPNPEDCKYPVSMIYAYNNHTNKLYYWGLDGYEGTKKSKENQMLTAFLDWWKKNKFDALIAWHHEGFDWPYLVNRAKKVLGIKLGEYISPIGKARWSADKCFKPAGVSILCLMEMYAKLTLNRKQSYALDAVAQDELEEESWGSHDFSDFETTKLKCKNDVVRMIKIDRKLNIMSQYDDNRRETKSLWEDLPQRTVYDGGRKSTISNNSKPIDQVMLSIAKDLGVVLPNKPKKMDYTETNKYLKERLSQLEKKYEDVPLDEEYLKKRREIIKKIKDGAYRICHRRGRFSNLLAVDLSGAYPSAEIDFCLDIANLRYEPVPNSVKIDCTYRETGELRDTYYFIQNPDAILPTTCRRLKKGKESLGEKKNSLDPSSEEFKEANIAYKASKSRVNAVFGSTGLSTFRLANKPVFNSTTFLIRDLLHYIEEQTAEDKLVLNLLSLTELVDDLEEYYCELLYIDTDGLFFNTSIPTEQFIMLLNNLTQQWAQDKYGKEGTQIRFDFEGNFKRIFIHALCHYTGVCETDNGIENKIRGMASKRSNTNKFVKKILKHVMKMILEWDDEKNDWKYNQDDVIEYLQSELENVRQKELLEFAFPAKLSRKLEHYDKKEEIYTRAVKNSKEFGMAVPKIGEIFYWIHVKPYAYDKYEVEEYYRMIAGKKEGTKKQKKILVAELNKLKKNNELESAIEKGDIIKKTRTRKKAKDVLAFTPDNINEILKDKEIDWKTMIRKNVIEKVNGYFESLGWDVKSLEVLV